VQTIDVLRDQQERRDTSLDVRDGDVRGIGLRVRGALAPHCVPIPHQLRIALECRRRCKLARVEVRPQPGLRIAKCRNAGFRRDTRTREHGNLARIGERAGESIRNGGRGRCHRVCDSRTRAKRIEPRAIVVATFSKHF